MAQRQVEEQRQEQRQQQTVTQQQLLQAQLIELPVQQLVERIETELHDNGALDTVAEEGAEGPESLDGLDNLDGLDRLDRLDGLDGLDGLDNLAGLEGLAGLAGLDNLEKTDGTADAAASDTSDPFDLQREREDRQDALDRALENFGRDDDELPVYSGGRATTDESEEHVYGQSESFYDQMADQVAMLDLDERQRYIMDYLIRSLDDDGLMRVPLENIVDELAIYHHVDTDEQEVERLLGELQQLDPAGIGARSLQECLLLQIDRREPSRLTTLMREVISNHFDDFTRKRWPRLQQQLKIGDATTDTLVRELRRLNPKPGASMGETIGRSLQQITPDFIVDTHDDGSVTFTLNNDDVPRLRIADTFVDLLQTYRNNREGMSRQMKEALLYTRQKVDAAQSFIDAVKTRQHTLYVTMKAIIHWQHRFFEEGDETLLRPMILKDIAGQTGLDISTISRVSNSKYAQTRWGIFPLKYFFTDGFVTESGETLSTREIKVALRELIADEDRRHPLSDDALSDQLRAKGYPVARRTVAKYRQQMNIPSARMRR